MGYSLYKKFTIYLVAGVLLLLGVQACKSTYFRSNYHDANKLLHATEDLPTKPFLKAHLKNGEVWILRDTWQINSIENTVSGYGSRYNFNRILITEGDLRIHIDSVAIFETNTKIESTENGRIAALTILTGLNIIGAAICFTNPKACFGSCPTFYINENDNFHYADAEGFSNAISPSLEYFDLDALNKQRISGHTFSITMKNEALETHCVNDVKLLAYPVKKGERVYQTPSNDLYLCENHYPLRQAVGPEGDMTTLLRNEDRQERFSLADENNLSSKEEIILTFDNVTAVNDLGLIVNFRQTLMTTYFIYSAMGYMGDEVSDFFARIETNEQAKAQLKTGFMQELGKIDIYAWDEDKQDWVAQKGFYETGPIAFNRQLLPLSFTAKNSSVRIKVVLNKGLWRMDYLALTNLKKQVKALEITPSTILNKGEPDAAALAKIQAPNNYLVAMPGDEYKFNFELPVADTDYELFLYTKGYYLEWMREYWLKDKDLYKLNQLVNHPKKYLRVEAKRYKQYESTMEQAFWESRIDTKNFSYHEN